MTSPIIIPTNAEVKHIKSGWIGVDLDGTLAQYDGFKGADQIGDPIPEMLARVKQWIAEGKTVKIFTARACVTDHIQYVSAWVLKHIGHDLEVTNIKDYGMVELWDDRAVRVRFNQGTPCCDHSQPRKNSYDSNKGIYVAGK